MSSPLYVGTIENKKGSTVEFRLTICHPDVSDFGTDRLFAWKLLSDWVSPPDDGSDLELAKKYIRRVDLLPLENGKVDTKGPSSFTVKRVGKTKRPSVVYRIEVTDPSLLDDLEVGASEEVYQYVEPGPALANEEPAAGGARRFELSAGTSNKFWEAAVDGKVLRVSFGRIGTKGTTQEKSFAKPALARAELDKLIREKLKKGYSEVGAAASAEAATASKPAATTTHAKSTRADAKTAPSAPRTLTDFCTTAVALTQKKMFWARTFFEDLPYFGEAFSEEQTLEWLAKLKGSKEHLSRAAGLMASERARSGNSGAARRFLALAESAAPNPKAHEYREALAGLIPAWWRMGQAKKAEAAFTKLLADPEEGEEDEERLKMMNIAIHAGAQTELERLMKELPKALGSFGSEALRPGMVALFRYRQDAALARMLGHWKQDEWAPEISDALAREAFLHGEPERFLELVLQFPDVLGGGVIQWAALSELERKDPARAVAIACQLLDEKFSVDQARALAILTAHAPAEATKRGSKLLKAADASDRLAILAALGRDEELRKALTNKVLSTYGYEDALRVTADVTADRTVAVRILQHFVRATITTDDCADMLVALIALGERAFVDATLEQELARLSTLSPPGDRDLPCRRLAEAAGVVGRVDLGLKAGKLPTMSVRYCTIDKLIEGCAQVGDWTGAFAALDAQTSDADRASSAVQSGLRSFARYRFRRSLPRSAQ
ncbi:MAG: WGR domain-containing protein [Kofleriaceae bacterium]|nr:WGR domain-containing protein [Kofleriaceae bacterium]